MKKMILPVLGLFTILVPGCKNSDKKTNEPQNKDYTISMDGIDSLKLGMSKPELEKFLQDTITLKHIGKDYSPDTVNVKYKGLDMILYLEKAYDSIIAIATLTDILTAGSACKTAAGIGVGSDKTSVINAYEDFTRYVAPEYEEYPIRSATKSVVAVADTAGSRALVFRIIDKKVVSIEVKSYYEFY